MHECLRLNPISVHLTEYGMVSMPGRCEAALPGNREEGEETSNCELFLKAFPISPSPYFQSLGSPSGSFFISSQCKLTLRTIFSHAPSPNMYICSVVL